MIVVVLPQSVLLHFVCDLKATQMNMQHSLIQEHALQIQTGHNVMEATKNVCCVKGEATVDHSTVTRLFKKLHSDCKPLDHLVRLDKLKMVYKGKSNE